MSLYASNKSSGGAGGGVTVYANLAAFPGSAPNGTLAVAGDTHIVYVYNSTAVAWQPLDTFSITADGSVTGADVGKLMMNFNNTAKVYQESVVTSFWNVLSANMITTGPGNTGITKTGNPGAFNEYAYSSTTIPNGTAGSFSFKLPNIFTPSGGIGSGVAGLTHLVTGPNYLNTLDFGIGINTFTNTVNIFENGVVVSTSALPTLDGTAIYEVRVSMAGAVTYYVNSVLRYTSAITATQALFPLATDYSVEPTLSQSTYSATAVPEAVATALGTLVALVSGVAYINSLDVDRAIAAENILTGQSVSGANNGQVRLQHPTTADIQIGVALKDATAGSIVLWRYTIARGRSTGINTGDQTNILGNAATVTTNANLTGPVTSIGNATAIANGAITDAMLATQPSHGLASNLRYYSSTTTVSSTLATVVYATQSFDSGSLYSAGTATIAVAGKYQINATLLLAGTAVLNNLSILEIQKNGTVISRTTGFAGGAVTDFKIAISDIINCAVNDTIRIQVSTTIAGPSILASNFDNYVSMAYVGT